jgi:hypothetical protein
MLYQLLRLRCLCMQHSICRLPTVGDQVPKKSAKLGCQFQLNLEVWCGKNAEPEVRPLVKHEHTNHTLGSLEDALLLRPDATIEARAVELLQLGLKPMQVSLYVMI